MIQLFKSYINQMGAITNNLDFSSEYYRIKDDQKLNFEDFSLQFANSITSFFKTNFSFIQDFDSIQGEFSSENEFTLLYMNEIYQGLHYLTQIQKINNEEIIKLTCDFFNWFAFKICFLIIKDADPEEIPADGPIQNYINATYQSLYYNKYYSVILDIIRTTLIEKMIRPVEVKIHLDEDGEIVVEHLIGTSLATLHETMRDTLIYITHLDSVKTQERMISILHTQTNDELWNVNLLNSVSWAIGCISGSLDEMEEKKFVVTVIKYLLTLCENKKGKTNKAFVASNIMYVVGQYYRFLNAHWRFLKTVVKKLFEFMHEFHPGVQDFACETFLKISLKCGPQFVIVNEEESEPYINTLTRNIQQDTKDLRVHQKLMFYEAIANMIACEQNDQIKVHLINQMLAGTYNEWKNIFTTAATDNNVLLDPTVIKIIDLSLKLNERVVIAVKTPYFAFASYILENILSSYVFYSNVANQLLQNQSDFSVMNTIKSTKSIKKSILKYLVTLISNTYDKEILMLKLLPLLAPLIDQYRHSHIENRDADTLVVFTEFMNKLGNIQYDYISSIWNYLCIFTLGMIQQDYSSYPDHRLNFFNLVKALISNAFEAIFKIQDSAFNKDVLNAIIWAFRHNQPNISETGLETLLILLNVRNFINIFRT